MKYIGSKVLESENLILRPTKEEDLKVIWNILCDIDVAKSYLVGKINYNWDQEKMTKSHGLIFMNYFMNIDSSDI